MPRSLVFCYDWISNESLSDIEKAYGETLPCHDTAVETMNLLANADMKKIFQNGLHEFLSDFIDRNNRLTAEIASAYNFP